MQHGAIMQGDDGAHIFGRKFPWRSIRVVRSPSSLPDRSRNVEGSLTVVQEYWIILPDSQPAGVPLYILQVEDILRASHMWLSLVSMLGITLAPNRLGP
jgi:hypothetical protein